VNQATEAVPAPNAGGSRHHIRPSPDLDSPGRVEREASVRLLVVVVPYVLVDDSLKMTPTQISVQSRHSCRTVRTRRSANALAFGALTGVLMTWVR
jgi:hypothetical protein